MTITLSVSGVTATAATLGFSGYGASGTIEVQISTRPDFQFAVAPIFQVARAATAAVSKLNQRASLYARARTLLSSGLREPWSNVIGFRTSDATALDLAPPAIVQAPAVIVVPEPVLSWTGDNTAAGFPASNLGIDAPVAWRAAPSSGIAYKVTLEMAGSPIDTIALLQTNCPEDATVFITAASSLSELNAATGDYVALAYGVPFRATANLPSRPGYHGLFRFAETARRFWRVEVDCTVPGSLIHVEHLILGLNRLTKNIANDAGMTGTNLGSMERSRSGAPDRQAGLPMRAVEFELAMLTETQHETMLADLYRQLGNPVLAVPNSKTGAFLHDRIIYGDLSGGRSTTISPLRFSRSFVIQSLI